MNEYTPLLPIAERTSTSTQCPALAEPYEATGVPTPGALAQVSVDSVHELDARYTVPPLGPPSVTQNRSFADCGRAEMPVTSNFTKTRDLPLRTRRVELDP